MRNNFSFIEGMIAVVIISIVVVVVVQSLVASDVTIVNTSSYEHEDGKVVHFDSIASVSENDEDITISYWYSEDTKRRSIITGDLQYEFLKKYNKYLGRD